MVEDMYNCSFDFNFYEHCIYGKHNRVIFPSGTTNANGILELIQCYVLGIDTMLFLKEHMDLFPPQ
jgi:hypothetical protein